MKPEESYAVAEFMQKDLVEVTPGTPVKAAAEVMATQRVSSAVVIQDSRIQGILTEKDLARKIVAKGLDPHETMVQDIMTKDLITTTPDTSLYDAMVLLNEKKIKHLPVVDNGIVVGLITAMDILRVQPALMDIVAGRQ